MSTNRFPLISVITPSYNQAGFIEETIESVLNQDYPNLEHIVIDGGSTDGTVRILEKYKEKLGERFRFVSEADRGQSHAINKGLSMAHGEIIGWLNSDDTYLPGAVAKAVHMLTLNPSWDMVYGRGYYTNELNQVIGKYPDEPFHPKRLFEGCIICQPAAFIRKEAFENVQGVNENIHFCMDYDLWMRIAGRYSIGFVDEYLANFRVHPDGKSSNQYVDIGLPEILESSRKNYGTIANSWLIEFIRGYLQRKGIYWIINQFKKHSVFGTCPIVLNTNRDDSLVPPYYSIIVCMDPNASAERLLISGENRCYHELDMFTCTVYVNGKYCNEYQIGKGEFELDVAINTREPYCTVGLVFDKHVIPKECKINHDVRGLFVYVKEVLPLSGMEYEFLKFLKENPMEINQWLYAKRNPNPDLGVYGKI